MGIEKNIDTNNFPKQYTTVENSMGGIGRKVEVCFNYKANKTIPGVIIRDDKELPFRMLIRLNDGRIILGTECQYRALPDTDEKVIKQFTFKNK
ncbi:hypothetical protein [Parabacteroides goldsteinii]|uniref:hypothetical protein n=1 Tax=Parabacteroides goldsteinii TaxID=328812 RepID=UPI0032B1D2C3